MTPAQFHDLYMQLALADPAVDRRSFVKLLGASIALAGLGACTGPPPRQLVPRVQGPAGASPSARQLYATALLAGGNVSGVLVETHEGRPTKIEGNPDHASSLGSSDALAQAAILELWDPERSREPRHRGAFASWQDFEAEAAGIRQRFAHGGRGLHVLSGAIVSPTLDRQRREFLEKFPGAQWHQYEAIDADQPLRGARLAFGKSVSVRYRFDQARVVVALEADFLASMPGHLRHARDFTAGRAPSDSSLDMARLYAIEATPSLTGAYADHAWPLESARIASFLCELAAALGIATRTPVRASGISAQRIAALVDDLQSHRGASLVIAGRSQPAAVHALAHAMNEHLRNVGRTVEYFEPPEPRAQLGESLRALTAAMDAGVVDTLVVLDGNPVFAAPGDLRFAERFAKVPRSIHLGLYRDETAELSTWHLPRAHPLESWSDLRAEDGTASIAQPVITPLYGGRSAHELLALLTQPTQPEPLAIVRATWLRPAALDDASWEHSLRTGVIAASRPSALEVKVDPGSLLAAGESAEDASTKLGDVTNLGEATKLELVFRPDATLWDGRYANNAWLQELPKPLTQLTWGNAALASPALARSLQLSNGDLLRLRSGARQLTIPVLIVTGQAANTLTLTLGNGRRHAGRVGTGVGTDVYPLRDPARPWRSSGLEVERAGGRVELALVQRYPMAGDVEQARETEALPPETKASLYPERARGAYSWGMTIDLNTCIGCRACTIACQAENNIPVVGADEVRRGREMHWIRIDSTTDASHESPRALHRPVPCMHCEHAPCELACPVGATVHDSEGLNLQVYNRCVGTRFCANNCPYKVRRFNFLQYADPHTEALKAQRNPNVSIRNRGVMEKCTYCIQRIETAHIAADRAGRRIADGEVVTACQEACPTRAIRFGDIADPASAVSRAKASPRNAALLAELNTRPRTTYLAPIRNVNPALKDEP